MRKKGSIKISDLTPSGLRDLRERYSLDRTQASLLVSSQARTWRSWETGERTMPDSKKELLLLRLKEISKK